jgi:hypothetical protein
MREVGKYNTDLHLFEEKPKVKMKTLLFHRWRAENNRRTLNIPTGEYALALTVTTGLPIDKAVEGAFVFANQQELLRRHVADTGGY